MTTIAEHRDGQSSWLWGLAKGGAGLAVATVVMNVSTYGFQVAAARVLGPDQYGSVAGLMALLMVVAVVQLGLQATAARRISASPDHVANIESAVLAVSYRAALLTGALLVVASPLVWIVLRLDSVAPALVLAAAAVPLTILGGQAGVLQGERRWVALGCVYMAMGVPRLVFGLVAVLILPTAVAAMVGVLLGLLVAVVVGRLALRKPRDTGAGGEMDVVRQTTLEAMRNSLALLAFFLLSNLDILVARNILDSRSAGLYAGGLILTKAVLFLPQFVVVFAFPAMSNQSERRPALLGALTFVMTIGAASTLAAWLLPGLAIVFVGGDDYVDVRASLWLFAVLGTLLSLLQLLVYSALARQSPRSAHLIWIAVAVLVVASLAADSVVALVTTVVAVDVILFTSLLALSLWNMRHDVNSQPDTADALGVQKWPSGSSD